MVGIEEEAEVVVIVGGGRLSDFVNNVDCDLRDCDAFLDFV